MSLYEPFVFSARLQGVFRQVHLGGDAPPWSNASGYPMAPTPSVIMAIESVVSNQIDFSVGTPWPDLILTPWVLGRRVPLEVYGPTGFVE